MKLFSLFFTVGISFGVPSFSSEACGRVAISDIIENFSPISAEYDFDFMRSYSSGKLKGWRWKNLGGLLIGDHLDKKTGHIVNFQSKSRKSIFGELTIYNEGDYRACYDSLLVEEYGPSIGAATRAEEIYFSKLFRYTPELVDAGEADYRDPTSNNYKPISKSYSIAGGSISLIYYGDIKDNLGKTLKSETTLLIINKAE